jgi:hypothetical protein
LLLVSTVASAVDEETTEDSDSALTVSGLISAVAF